MAIKNAAESGKGFNGSISMSKRALTEKQELYCRKFAECKNKSEAYRFAYTTERMKPETVNRSAFQLHEKPKIATRIAELMRPVYEKLEASTEKTLKRLMQGQEFDVRKLYHPDGKLKSPHELDDDTARAIVGVKYDKDTGDLIEYKVIDVKGCCELIGKHLKMFTDRTEHTVDPDDPFAKALLGIDGATKGKLPDPAPEGDA